MANKMTAFQEEVMFWQGRKLQHDENMSADEEIKSLALSAEMDGVVDTICRMLGDAKPDDEEMVAFKVWQSGLCFDITDSSNRLGKSEDLASMLYRSNDTLRALQYRGNLEGFKVLRHARSGGSSCNNLKSYVIMFVSPDV
ncbi:hypothetical protein FWF89_03925 [Candidatus Saccharibacteria bacterium]|nr:hypothetical protein [Candidatus Saccharibacteria bacterium]